MAGASQHMIPTNRSLHDKTCHVTPSSLGLLETLQQHYIDQSRVENKSSYSIFYTAVSSSTKVFLKKVWSYFELRVTEKQVSGRRRIADNGHGNEKILLCV